MGDGAPLPGEPTAGLGNAADRESLLSVTSLSVRFGRGTGPVVDGLDFALAPGETLAIVGESGSGKSVTSHAIMRLTDYAPGADVTGAIEFRRPDGSLQDMLRAAPDTIRAIRGNEIAMIFQEPMTSLNPVFSVGNQIAEAVMLHQGLDHASALRQAEAMLDQVRIPDAVHVLDRYPHQLSGGMRQRVMIAMALSCRPRLLIADEPTTALDVTIQAQILSIIREQQRELGMAVIFITHDMGVVAEIADRVLVMRAGAKVEEAPVRQLFRAPAHPYTKLLLNAVPHLGTPGNALAGAFADRKAAPPLCQVDGLTARFDVRHDRLGRVTHRVHAVEEVSFEIQPGETLALVGESGSGKTTIGRMIQQLTVPTGGKIRFRGKDVAELRGPAQRAHLQKVQYVFQDPYASLDPKRTVGDSIAEPIRTHRLLNGRRAIETRVAELLQRVGLEPGQAKRYPHEFSGGQRQRICIARALASEPELIIADEAVSALDVSIRAQVLDLFMQLQAERGLAYLFITHDMAVVERISHRVAVLYLGQLVEIGPAAAVLGNPQHSYTRRLLSAVPVPDPDRVPDRSGLTGEIRSPVRPVGETPPIARFRREGPGHLVATEDGAAIVRAA
ncbi:ABC transporter ATP-binding protein [Mangrovibrevibacter kandeliae]|uniref:ABC transporter ATP-binding protein n=1 Tax=Mangrovibrevibacter kandeliae TaxID=2968473 RepID=UPI0021189DF9|nr:ABC transporter ATP-binding protein [Aurantimonas sp. CSK15Z-1]MCQ8780683.1 ABC transporter ATP-binding protein [Aurantimonas sp. CSK15Z-1]